MLSLFAVVSDAAAGGQVLMCAATFRAVKGLTGELGCVTKDGMQLDRLKKPSFWAWYVPHDQHVCVCMRGLLSMCLCLGTQFQSLSHLPPLGRKKGSKTAPCF